jgi:pyridoxal phosphate enzyme (YggS family)
VVENRGLDGRLARLQERVRAAAERAGRKPESVRIMAVTKTVARAAVEEAMGAGMRLFGENRVQEAVDKYSGLYGACELHLIGHLQRNKARSAARVFACVQSIDKTETAEALSKQRAVFGLPIDILLEMNTSGEESKSGFRSRDELLSGLDSIAALPMLTIRGLMTVGPLSGDSERVRASFRALAGLFRDIAERMELPGFDTLSMGMSGDFETAIEEGSTLVRIGTALFGQRT